uniref:Lipid-binding serum glycoprotein C-terminal domain-containing protein n=1 Tax=Panagrolaimus davidi TaxID=227884 RepID=A0A914PN22_9BILA
MLYLRLFCFISLSFGVLSQSNSKNFVSPKHQRPKQRGYLTEPNFAGNPPQLSPNIIPLPSFQDTLPNLLSSQIAVKDISSDEIIKGSLPSIRARLNKPAFEYLSTLLPPIIDNQIKKARILPIKTCPPILDGCVYVNNIYVSRYRCPQNVAIYPSPPDQLVLAVENFDFGITGNLGGYIKILRRKLFGIVQVNAHQVSVTVAIKIIRGQTGAPMVEMVDCQVTVGIADAYVEHGGLLGIIANKIFRQTISKQAKDLIPEKVCETIPMIINEKLNSRLASLPRSLEFTQLLQAIGGPLDFTQGSITDGCGNPCRSAGKTRKAIKPLPLLRAANRGKRSPYAKPLASTLPRSYVVLRGSKQYVPKKNALGVYTANEDHHRRQIIKARAYAANVQFIENGEQSPCASCGGVESSPNPFCQFKQMLALLDIRKLNGITLSIDFLKTYATSLDYNLDLNGIFSSGILDDFPYEPYPVEFPRKIGIRMVEGLINEYTINTLLHSLTKNGFFAFALGPGTPKIGSFLKTTCNDDPADYGTDDENEQKTRSLISVFRRHRRQTSFDNALANFGVCLGDLLPSLKRFYPNQDIIIQIYLEQDPILALSIIRGGTAILDLLAMADFTSESGATLGSLRIKANLEVQIRFGNSQILGHGEITQFRLSNPDGLFGISQIALDKVGEIGQAILEKTLNQMLQNGIPIQFSTSNLGVPLEIIDPQIKIIEHAIHLETDFTLSESILKEFTGDGNCRR